MLAIVVIVGAFLTLLVANPLAAPAGLASGWLLFKRPAFAVAPVAAFLLYMGYIYLRGTHPLILPFFWICVASVFWTWAGWKLTRDHL